MSHYKPYPVYKNSGVEWIGRVPEHWETLRIKRAAALRNERRNDLPNGWTYVGLEDVEPESGRYAPTKGESRQSDDSMVGVSRAGDVLYGKLRPYLRKAIVAERDGVCSTEFLVLIAGRAAATWLHCWLLTPDVTQQIEAGCDGAKMPRADWEHVGSIPMPLPPPAEQSAIAAALDRETIRIDALIAKKTCFIELLKEKRSALITHAVTKGFDPDVKMKDSGVEWIGEVPEHWNTARLANIGSFSKGGGGTKADDADVGVACIRYGDIYTTYDTLIRKIVRFITEQASSSYTPIQHGDILLAASGETFEEIGKSSAYLGDENSVCGGDVIILRPVKIVDPAFLAYALASSVSQSQKSLMGKGFTVIHIYAGDLRDLVIVLPPKDEQRSISRHLETKLASIDDLITTTQRSIDLLKERRSAFIAAAVTGQIDLRFQSGDLVISNGSRRVTCA